jgi:hypothetical protein
LFGEAGSTIFWAAAGQHAKSKTAKNALITSDSMDRGRRLLILRAPIEAMGLSKSGSGSATSRYRIRHLGSFSASAEIVDLDCGNGGVSRVQRVGYATAIDRNRRFLHDGMVRAKRLWCAASHGSQKESALRVSAPVWLLHP